MNDDYCFDIGPMGAIGEQGSLMFRVNRNCPWNRCLFCSTYKSRTFEYRAKDELLHDVDVISRLAAELRSIPAGAPGTPVMGVIAKRPDVYEDEGVDEETLDVRHACLSHVGNWLSSGARTVFLQDADAVIMRTMELVEVIVRLKQAFPSIERITSYSRSKTCSHKTPGELEALHEAGLSRVLIGLESGCDEVLTYVQKGATAEEHVRAGQRIREAGMNLVEFVMPGLGGAAFRDRHIAETTRVLNEIRPHLIRMRSLAVQRSSPLYRLYEAGEFQHPTDDEMVSEIDYLVRNIDFPCNVETGQLTNVLFEIRGRLPEDLGAILKVIDGYKALSPRERLKFRFSRYSRYYFPYIIQRGRGDLDLEEEFEEAYDALERGLPDAEARVERVLLDMKSRGIP